MHDDNASPPSGPNIGRGLQIWLGLLVVFGAGGLLFGGQDLAFLAVMTGVCVAAQAADLEPRWQSLYRAMVLIIVLFAVTLFITIGAIVMGLDLGRPLKAALAAMSMASAGIALLTLFVPFANVLVRLMFRVDASNHTLRLAARLTLFSVMFVVPGWFALREFIESLFADPKQIIEQLTLGSSLIGYVLLALGSVGMLVRRDVRATLDRLGIGALGMRELVVVVLGTGVLLLLNGAGEVIQRSLFPQLWTMDRNIVQALVDGLTKSAALMVGITAGVGEEITLRGALQPRLGIVLTSLLFASLHVQYTWFGMLMIFIFGCVLGVIRRRTNTTTAMGVHALYDIVALLLT